MAWLNAWRARPRLLASFAVGVVVMAAVPPDWLDTAVTRALLAWNVAVLLYVGLAGAAMAGATHADMRERARAEDEGRWTVLVLFSAMVVASLVAIALQLAVARDHDGSARAGHVALAGLTVLSSWSFLQVLFTLHYAHEFYGERGGQARGGLAFPGTPQPLYGDFLYMACSIGTSGQTSDVSFTNAAMRRIGTLHCVLAFFFNTTILALTINIAAGMV